MRLVTKASLARQAGVSRAAITKQCSRGLARAVRDGRVDLDHPAVREYLSSRDRGKTAGQNPVAEVAKKTTTATPEVTEYLDLTLRELTERFGTAQRFAEWLDAVRKIETIRGQRLDNEEAEKLLIRWEMVDRSVFGALDALFRRLLTDAPKTIAKRARSAALAGETTEATEEAICEILGAVLEVTKREAQKALLGD